MITTTTASFVFCAFLGANLEPACMPQAPAVTVVCNTAQSCLHELGKLACGMAPHPIYGDVAICYAPDYIEAVKKLSF
jgi:hypothetical protein